MIPEQVKLADGAVGYFAQDADGRVLWSVRFPAHVCYSTSDPNADVKTWHCEVGANYPTGEAPQTFRHGKAANEEAARREIAAAFRLGRPTADTSDSQFMRA